MTATMKQRIERIQQAFDCFAMDSAHRFRRESVSEEVLAKLAGIEDFPQDYLVILRRVGTIAKWGNKWLRYDRLVGAMPDRRSC